MIPWSSSNDLASAASAGVENARKVTMCRRPSISFLIIPSSFSLILFLRAGFYLCGDRTGLCDVDYLRDFTLVRAIGVDESVGARLRGLKSQDDSPVGFG